MEKLLRTNNYSCVLSPVLSPPPCTAPALSSLLPLVLPLLCPLSLPLYCPCSSPPLFLSDLGLLMKSCISNGQLVPDDVISRLILADLRDIDHTSWLLDGTYLEPGTCNTAHITYNLDLAPRTSSLPDSSPVTLTSPFLCVSRSAPSPPPGFPRTVAQAEALDSVYSVDTVLNLDVPFQTIQQRLTSRWLHLPSGRVYNINFKPPKIAVSGQS